MDVCGQRYITPITEIRIKIAAQYRNTNDTTLYKTTDVKSQSTLTQHIRHGIKEIINDNGIRKIPGRVVKAGMEKTPGIGTALVLLDT